MRTMTDKLHILLADDHAIVRRGVQEILTEHFPHATFGEAASAQETLEKSWGEPWDLILLDVSMPGRSGLDVLKDLRAAQPKAAILVLSMHSEDQFAVRMLKAGADGYVTKDSLSDELVAAVRKVLSGGRYVSLSLAERLAGLLTTAGRERHENLSDREFQIMRMVALGRGIKEIASELGISAKTVTTYRARVLEKMELETNADLTKYALQYSLI
jgi:DNA-binding NarL/FixJ family response regulator